ncbi:(2Fe-2S)-binding protein [Verticiella sediminum]|uniref:(2Fe-2S)-binding protein n=1 Tax=Verticiella sediminum TaxID=1247510 RepID=A0A556B0V7_9BURK|nr:(2Fe-2S)-binding protein [Verticiella sediminum]TSH98800.1 (2Fe-2S)-binding protein [Verticiella sediminum]
MSPLSSAAPRAVRSSKYERGPAVRFLLDGQEVTAHAGESVAAALLAAGRRALRTSPVQGAPRGAFCFMGSCQECVVWVENQRMPACQVAVREGLRVETLPAREART